MKKYAVIILVGVVMGAGGFFGGYKYAQSKAPRLGNFQNLSTEQRAQFFGGNGTGGTRRTGQGGMGMVSGQVISMDGKSITVKMQNGSTKNVFYSGSTQVRKTADGAISDVSSGTEVTVMGAANSDGSITAQNIQIRPAGSEPAFPGRQGQ